MKQSGLSLPLSFIIWRRQNFLWNTVYLTLVLWPATELALLLLHRALLRLPWWVFKPGNEMIKLLCLSRCLSFSLLLCRLADHFSKVSPGRQSMWKGRRGGLEHSHKLLLFKGFLVEHRTQQIPPQILTEPTYLSFYFICLFLQKDWHYYGKEHWENKRNLNNILLWNILVTAKSICAAVF